MAGIFAFAESLCDGEAVCQTHIDAGLIGDLDTADNALITRFAHGFKQALLNDSSHAFAAVVWADCQIETFDGIGFVFHLRLDREA